MISLRDKENELFEKWKNARPRDFAKDGAGCEYEKSDLKLLFVLKETNQTDCTWDVRDRLDTGMMYKNGKPIRHTWNNIYCWASFFFNKQQLNKCTAPDEANERMRVFRKIAAMNLKKESGKSSSDYEEIRQVAIEDSDFIKQQIELYNPDIIVCCGKDLIYNRIKDIFNAKNLEGCNTTRMCRPEINGKLALAFDFYHPQARKKKSDLQEILNEVQKRLER